MSYWDNTKNFNPLPPYGGRLSTSIIAPNIGRNFNPLPPYGGRRSTIIVPESSIKFQSTPSVWRETHGNSTGSNTSYHFNPLPPYGGRHLVYTSYHLLYTFQSTPSVWRETIYLSADLLRRLFQSTPSVWRETVPTHQLATCIAISIHSLRMEGDTSSTGTQGTLGISIHSLRMEGDYVPIYDRIVGNISIHSLRMEGDWIVKIPLDFLGKFQSTPSVWRETRPETTTRWQSRHFNPLPPYGGRLHRRFEMGTGQHFNPLPPYGGRPEKMTSSCAAGVFQSTPSVWRETHHRPHLRFWVYISIHSLRMEGDCIQCLLRLPTAPISIHSLRMEGDVYAYDT